MEVHQIREDILDKTQIFQDKMKNFFDNRVLKWEVRIEDKGKHSKFDHLW